MRRALIATGAATILGAMALLAGAPALADLVDVPDPKPAASAIPPASAAAPPPGASSDHESIVVARVGNLTISAADLDRRLAQTPPFQLKPYGSTPEAIRRAFLDQVMVKELLIVREAEDRKLAERPELADRVRATHRSALVADVRRQVGQDAVTDDDVKAYYAANLQKFVAPQKVAIFRILVASEADAKAIIAQLGKTPDVKVFGAIAREKSLDKETAMRGGNLGFVQPDGETGQRGQKVDVALLEATKSLKDGELAPEPVKEGRNFAVVWKRQTMRAVTRPIETERAGIRQLLAQERMQGAMNKLLEGLRSSVEQHPEMVEVIAIDPQGDMSRAIRPGTLPRSKRGARPQPEQGPIGPR
jgi:peptidyl-prolyl cis-trans isomerase C